MNVAQLLARTARVHPDRVAIFHGQKPVLDYRNLADRAGRIAASLRHRYRIVPGERVGLFMSNSPEYLEILYGIWFAGLVAVPINAKLHASEARFILQDAGASVLFISSEPTNQLLLQSIPPTVRAVFATKSADYAALLNSNPSAAPYSCEPNDLAWLFYTSGTTGQPKGAMLTHRNLLAMTMSFFADVDQASKQDSIVHAAPMSHGSGLYNFPYILVGASHIIPESHGFDPSELALLATKYSQLAMFAAPTMVKRLVDHVAAHACDLSGFKTIIYGGGPMYIEDIRRAMDVMGDRFVQIYGQGESPMTITSLSREHLADRSHARYNERISSVGVAQSVVEVGVADSEGRRLSTDQVGEVVVRGETVMRGYWNNPQATKSAIRDDWLFTGDIGSLDSNGFLTLRDRSKDMIISGGSNVYPREVEEILLRHRGVREVAVVGQPHSEWGEEVVAFIVTHPGLTITEQELDTLCLQNIARFKRPKTYHFVPELPKNNYGKVLKTELRQKLLAEKGA